MSLMLQRRTMTEAEFLAWVDPLEERHEFDGTGPVAMVGGSLRHGVIQANLLRALGTALLDSPWMAIGSDTFVRAAASLRLPDVLVMRDPFDPDARVIDEPIVVFEILSPGTAQVDRVVKAREYWAAPSIEHYVMLEQDHPGAVLLSRGARDWQRHVVGQDQALALPAIGVRLDLAELYRRLAPAARTPSQG